MSHLEPITTIINKKAEDMNAGEQHIYEHIYQQLRQMAKIQKYKIRNQPIDTTMLVHEAWIKLKKSDKAYNNRAHFFAVAALAMKHILISQAQKKKLQMADVATENITADNLTLMQEIDFILDINYRLEKFSSISTRLTDVFVFRFFGGMTLAEIAEVFSVDVRTIDRDWKKIKVLMAAAITK